MKLFAIVNWADGTPQIAAIDGFPCVVMRRDILEKILPQLQAEFTDIKFSIVEFKAVEAAPQIIL